MDQQVFSEIKPNPKSKRPLIALLLALSSIVFCSIPSILFIKNFDEVFDVLWGNLPLWIFSESFLCLGALVALVGVIMGSISLLRKDENKVLGISAILIGIIAIVVVAFAMFLFLVTTFWIFT